MVDLHCRVRVLDVADLTLQLGRQSTVRLDLLKVTFEHTLAAVDAVILDSHLKSSIIKAFINAISSRSNSERASITDPHLHGRARTSFVRFTARIKHAGARATYR